ncbi:hypothetical protein QEV69_10150 [Trueperella pyogenes]|uniref:Uncharacterized protein n=1 Tax=Trueperella pyogenes TaxID=1661 RepID=A0ABV3N9R8_9ACTO|nr:hypothetical protein [Trueperella pyogenes]AHU90413.1 hypothetical protein CQ11_02150 [Trueperella pyogenes]AWA42919.1 hypothetical protein DBV13_02155 [Trueperella pyogenes]AZR00143.1 hypothetical protein EB776_01825 [Trueperella pyogenes]AZR03169.1 hypothetical protein EB775_07590 [Trueperella pyogenes]MCI7690307.1 hypothetical protein [Trueperella pyogenes]
MFWEAGTPFGLTSLKLFVGVTVLGLVAVVYLLWRLQKRTERPTILTRFADAGLYTAAVVLPVMAVFLHFNRDGNFYASFSELVEQIVALS